MAVAANMASGLTSPDTASTVKWLQPADVGYCLILMPCRNIRPNNTCVFGAQPSVPIGHLKHGSAERLGRLREQERQPLKARVQMSMVLDAGQRDLDGILGFAAT